MIYIAIGLLMLGFLLYCIVRVSAMADAIVVEDDCEETRSAEAKIAESDFIAAYEYSYMEEYDD